MVVETADLLQVGTCSHVGILLSTFAFWALGKLSVQEFLFCSMNIGVNNLKLKDILQQLPGCAAYTSVLASGLALCQRERVIFWWFPCVRTWFILSLHSSFNLVKMPHLIMHAGTYRFDISSPIWCQEEELINESINQTFTLRSMSSVTDEK